MMKKLLIAVLALFAFVLVFPALLPTQASISRSIEINAPVQKVHAFVLDLNQFNRWSPFKEKDPEAATQISGSGVGATYSWQGKHNGEGKMTLAQIEPNKAIQVKMDFYKPMNGEAVSEWATTPTATGGTQVTWSFSQELPYFRRILGLIMPKMMGAMFEKGLLNLKNQIEGAR